MVEQPTPVPSGGMDKGERWLMLCNEVILPSPSNVLTIPKLKNPVKNRGLIFPYNDASDSNYKGAFKLFLF